MMPIARAERLIVALYVATPNAAKVLVERLGDAAQAFANGADYIVVGRPIRSAADPRAAAQAIQRTIAAIFP